MEDNQPSNPDPYTPQPPVQQFSQTPEDNTPEEIPKVTYSTWTAKEFIEQKKPGSWFLILAVVVIIISVIVYFVVHSIFPIVMVVLIGIVFAIVAVRKPKDVEYELSNYGVAIGRRLNPYTEFKSFSVVDEGGVGAILLNPLKRFAFPTTIYYDLKNEDEITKVLSGQLPMEEPPDDPVENLMRKIRF